MEFIKSLLAINYKLEILNGKFRKKETTSSEKKRRTQIKSYMNPS